MGCLFKYIYHDNFSDLKHGCFHLDQLLILSPTFIMRGHALSTSSDSANTKVNIYELLCSYSRKIYIPRAKEV